MIIWGLQQTFCALVQRIGRAGRNVEADAKAILIVNPKTADGKLTEDAVCKAVTIAAIEGEALDCPIEETEVNQAIEELDGEGVRIAAIDVSDDSDKEDIPQVQTGSKRKRAKTGRGTDIHINETRVLLEYFLTKMCQRRVWNKFFGNEHKSKFYNFSMLRLLTPVVN